MTILFLARRFYPQIGGVEKHVLEISKLLIKKGHKIIVITETITNLASTNVTKFMVEGITVYTIPVGTESRLKKFRIWRQMWTLRKLISNWNLHLSQIY